MGPGNIIKQDGSICYIRGEQREALRWERGSILRCLIHGTRPEISLSSIFCFLAGICAVSAHSAVASAGFASCLLTESLAVPGVIFGLASRAQEGAGVA